MGWGKGPEPGGSLCSSHREAADPFRGSPVVQANRNTSTPVDMDLRSVSQASDTGLDGSGGQGQEHGLSERAE